MLPPGELPRAASRGLGAVLPLAPVVLEGRIIGGMRGGDQAMADDLGPGEFPERPVPLLILKDPAVLSTADPAPILGVCVADEQICAAANIRSYAEFRNMWSMLPRDGSNSFKVNRL